jgi:hypothetical protein
MKNASSDASKRESRGAADGPSAEALDRGGGTNVVRGGRSSAARSTAPVFDIRRCLGTGFGDRRVVEILAIAGGVGAEESPRQRVTVQALAGDLAVLLALLAQFSG